VGGYYLVKGKRAVVVDCDDWEGWGGWNDIKPYPWLVKEFIDRHERWMMRKAPALTVASRSLNRRVLEARGSENGVYYVPNGVPADTTSSIYATISSSSAADIKREFALPEGVLILYSGHFEPAEDPMFLCRVSARVAQENRAALVLVGDGPEVQCVRNFFAQRPAARVRLFPRLPHTQFLQLVHACDIAAFPYPDNQVHRAKCSARIVDYMRMGKAVITSAVGQNLEYLENSKSGLLVPPNDEDAFAAGLDLLLRYPELRARLGSNARIRIQEAFSWSGQPLEQCLAAYEHLTRSAS
jgi:glycosyltransferase involved in cell wall biosynthesis